jgi:hypothetical protein
VTTRQEYINASLGEIGIATYFFDLAPEQQQSCKLRLNTLMAQWNAQGIRLAYNMPATPDGGDLDDETGTPDTAWQAIVSNLAIAIAPMFGKTPNAETKVMAKRSFNTIASIAAQPVEVQLRQLPAGAGNKPWRFGQPFLNPPVEPILAGPDGPLGVQT